MPVSYTHLDVYKRQELTRADTVRSECAIARDEGRLAHVLREGVHRHHPWEVPSVFVDESMFPLPDGGA